MFKVTEMGPWEAFTVLDWWIQLVILSFLTIGFLGVMYVWWALKKPPQSIVIHVTPPPPCSCGKAHG
jgi:hypothetical protein